MIGRPRIEQQADHRVAEGGLLLAHEGQRLVGVDDHARQPRRIENALFQIELPGAVLLRHQPALQPVGEPRDDALEVRELLVEIGAQPLQLVMVAEVLGRDDLVEFRREGVIFGAARLVGATAVRPCRLARRLVIAKLAVIQRIGRRRLRRLHRALRHLVRRRLRLVGTHLLRGVGLRRALGTGLVVVAVAIVVVVLILFRIGVALIAEIERRQQVMDEVAELGLILGEAAELVELRADSLLQEGPPEIDHLARRIRRRQTGQPLAHHHRERIRQRRIGAVGDLVIFAAMEVIVEHRGEILGDTGHALGTDGLDTGLLDRLEHAARLRIARDQLAVNLRIMTGEFQRDGISMAAHDRGIALGHLARGLRQPRFARRKARPLGGEGDFELGRSRDRAQAAGHRALERLGRRLLGSGTEFAVGCRHLVPAAVVPANAGSRSHRRSFIRVDANVSVVPNVTTYGPGLAAGTTPCQLSATLTADSGSSALKQR